MGLEQQRMDMMAKKDFLDKLVQTCPDGIIGIDRKGTVIIFNAAAEKLTGLAVADVIGKYETRKRSSLIGRAPSGPSHWHVSVLMSGIYPNGCTDLFL